MEEKWNTVKLLSHMRHDWLNYIQLIKGNLSLNRIDRVEDIIDELIIQSQQESNLSNLKMPRVAEQMLTFNWEDHAYQLEFEVIDHDSSFSMYDDELYRFQDHLFTWLDDQMNHFEMNHLNVLFHAEEHKMIITYECDGKIEKKQPFSIDQNKFPHLNVVKQNDLDHNWQLIIELSRK